MNNTQQLDICNDFFNKHNLILEVAEERNKCWSCIVKSTSERIDPMKRDELKEFLNLVYGECVDVRMQSDKTFTWATFYTTAVD